MGEEFVSHWSGFHVSWKLRPNKGRTGSYWATEKVFDGQRSMRISVSQDFWQEHGLDVENAALNH